MNYADMHGIKSQEKAIKNTSKSDRTPRALRADRSAHSDLEMRKFALSPDRAGSHYDFSENLYKSQIKYIDRRKSLLGTDRWHGAHFQF